MFVCTAEEEQATKGWGDLVTRKDNFYRGKNTKDQKDKWKAELRKLWCQRSAKALRQGRIERSFWGQKANFRRERERERTVGEKQSPNV